MIIDEVILDINELLWMLHFLEFLIFLNNSIFSVFRVILMIMKLLQKLLPSRYPIKRSTQHAKSSEILEIKAIGDIESCVVTFENFGY